MFGTSLPCLTSINNLDALERDETHLKTPRVGDNPCLTANHWLLIYCRRYIQPHRTYSLQHRLACQVQHFSRHLFLLVYIDLISMYVSMQWSCAHVLLVRYISADHYVSFIYEGGRNPFDSAEKESEIEQFLWGSPRQEPCLLVQPEATIFGLENISTTFAILRSFMKSTWHVEYAQNTSWVDHSISNLAAISNLSGRIDATHFLHKPKKDGQPTSHR